MQPVRVLHVDDNADELTLTQAALDASGIPVDFQGMSDGREAMAFLRREGPYANAVLPDLIVLDLNMPRIDGRGVLAELRADEELQTIPVVMLSDSTDNTIVRECYALGANCYITKPRDFEAFERAAKCIMEHWGKLALLPTPPVTNA